ncbi:MAG: radical SAM protein [Candidatus Marinimicrobia bacterium]|nr:radical SAM protein [Candidatus Neomarinimicrobiota bacterium]MBL7023215.1 radical SAM protein [Candidatus Neomarinimicrobiota bacterium]
MILNINEIFYSIQGESTHAGKPCIFIRLAKCNLRCSYCDTGYAYEDGSALKIDEILNKIGEYNCKLVEITGGEPLLQENVVFLMKQLISNNYTVLLETNGSISTTIVPREVIKFVDFKCPSSKMDNNNLWSIIDELQPHDEVKFVIGNVDDYEWTKSKLIEYNLLDKCTVLLAPVFKTISPKLLASWILEDNLDCRLQLQLHKIIWDHKTRGV